MHASPPSPVLLTLLLGACVALAHPLPAEMMPEMTIRGDASQAGSAGGLFGLKLDKPTGRAEVLFRYKDPALDLGDARDVAVTVRNGTASELDVLVAAASQLKDAWRHSTTGRFLVRPQEEMETTTLLPRGSLPKDHPHVKRFGNLFGFPWGYHRHWIQMDPSSIVQVKVQIDWMNAEVGQTIEVSPPRGSGEVSTDPALLETFAFPMVDEFGQARWLDWPGKVRAARELEEDSSKDLAMAAAVTGPGEGRSRFGGMAGGPKLEATGFFRVEKVNGKWWFVDPEGNLFWSLGVNCMGAAATTKVQGREELFPETWRSEPNRALYDENLKLKHGAESWREDNLKVSLARMFGWGLNTVGAWSRADFLQPGQIPYTIIIHTDMQGLGSVGKIPDPYSKAFTDSVERYTAETAKQHAESPWLLGVFIDNELEWHGDNKLAKEVMNSPRETPARIALIDFLRERYGDVAALNKAWGTNFDDIAAVKPWKDKGGNEAYEKDLNDFLALFAERYFSVCRAAMDKHFPNHLYLDCRFHVRNPIITAAASRHCDVISVNIYQHSFEGLAMATDQDRPWIISEYHFGIRDHGNLGVGLTWAADARNQADLVQAYLSDALRHPNYVGAHWFAWNDQGVTGRGDGENFGVGLVTITDRPVETLGAAMRTVSDSLYPFRLGDSQGRIGAGPSAVTAPPAADAKPPVP
jgi:hypothetical protein